MKKYDKLWHECNTLLSHLRASKVPALVQDYYKRFNNDAPEKLLQKAMDDLQASLDGAEKGKTNDLLEMSKRNSEV